ncbi:MAG: hypothetical protein GY821_17785 [Gammaproteobacteria bacterium]|nr:hypothetical protein [Gammaproteobacteria bacterium]
MIECDVIISKVAQKQLRKLPVPIVLKLQTWIDGIKVNGIKEVRKISGFHDEPLKGQRKGQRSIRLSRAYRAIYCLDDTGSPEIIEILEVNKHDY